MGTLSMPKKYASLDAAFQKYPSDSFSLCNLLLLHLWDRCIQQSLVLPLAMDINAYSKNFASLCFCTSFSYFWLVLMNNQVKSLRVRESVCLSVCPSTYGKMSYHKQEIWKYTIMDWCNHLCIHMHACTHTPPTFTRICTHEHTYACMNILSLLKTTDTWNTNHVFCF